MAPCNPRSKPVGALCGEIDRVDVLRTVIRASHELAQRGRTPQEHPIAFDPEHPNVAV